VPLAPSGRVIGIDMRAAVEFAAARHYDLAVLSELLPAAEAGLVEAPSSDRVRNDGLNQLPAMTADCLLAAILTHMRDFRLP
jgi:hypothetical protein